MGRLEMANTLPRRKFLKLLGTGLASFSAIVMGPTFGFSSTRGKRRLKKAESCLSSAKRAELRRRLQEMRTDLRKCKEALIARKKAGKRFGHLASQLVRKQRTLRNYHIALSELRGKTRHQIEHPRQDNQPCEDTIARIKKRFS